MGLDIQLKCTHCESVIYQSSITHNLSRMAEAAGLYKALWRPNTLEIRQAKDLLPVLDKGMKALLDNPESMKCFTPANDYGSYDELVGFVKRLTRACEENPCAEFLSMP